MDHRDEARDFLTSRRDRLTPGQAGVPLYGGRRRVTGLRREEVAMLAGMSTDYYTRLERGNLSGVSDTVLGALARAPQLDEAERAHLFDLAATAGAPGQTERSAPGGPGAGRPRRSSSPPRVREGVLRVLDSISAPAYVRNNRMDVLAANRLGRALFADLYAEAPPASTLPATSSSTRAPVTSTPNGTPWPATPSPPCGSKPAATPTTAA